MATNRKLFTNPFRNYDEPFTVTHTYGDLTDQVNKVQTIENTRSSMENQITSIGNLKTDLSGTDFSGNYVDDKYKNSTVQDALNEDLQYSIVQRNNAYIIGMITVSTVLITTFLVLKK
jgi:hypothetical protein